METVSLSISDRVRIDALIDELEKYNRSRDSEVLVSCTEAARLLNKSIATVSKMIREGRLKKTTIGRSTGIPLSDIREQAAVMR